MATFTVEWAKDPKYFSPSVEAISLTVKFYENAKPVSFCACSYDSEEYGRQLWADATAGVYGPVAPYVEDPILTTTESIQTIIGVLRHYQSIVPMQSKLTSDSATAMDDYVAKLEHMLNLAEDAFDIGVAYRVELPEPPELFLQTKTGKPVPLGV